MKYDFYNGYYMVFVNKRKGKRGRAVMRYSIYQRNGKYLDKETAVCIDVPYAEYKALRFEIEAQGNKVL